MSGFLSYLKAWWATHVTWISLVVYFLDPSVQAWVNAHPGFSATLGAAWAILLHILPAPAGLKKLFTPKNGAACLLAFLLIFTPGISGCSAAWVSTFDNILASAAPALIDILEIWALATGHPVPMDVENKITTDSATLKTTVADFANASAAAQPGLCPQVNAALSTYEADLPAVLQIVQVSDPVTSGKISTLSSLVAGLFLSLEPLIPSCNAQSPQTVRTRVHNAAAPPLTLSNFVKSYNAVLVSPTGNPSVDDFTKKHKLPEHSRFVHWLTLGIAH